MRREAWLLDRHALLVLLARPGEALPVIGCLDGAPAVGKQQEGRKWVHEVRKACSRFYASREKSRTALGLIALSPREPRDARSSRAVTTKTSVLREARAHEGRECQEARQEGFGDDAPLFRGAPTRGRLGPPRLGRVHPRPARRKD